MLLRQELKHLLHCPSTWVVAIISLLLACLTPFLSLMGTSIDEVSPSGTRATISGPAALSAWRDIESPLEGEISVERLEAALSVYQQLIKEYGENIPDDVYIRQGYPIEAYLKSCALILRAQALIIWHRFQQNPYQLFIPRAQKR